MRTINDLQMNCAFNQRQGPFKRVLFVCRGGICRSATAAWLFGQQPWNYNTRSAGIEDDGSLTFADDILIFWAQEIVCMEKIHEDFVRERIGAIAKQLGLAENIRPKVFCLNIPDVYAYREPALVFSLYKEYMSVTGAQRGS